MTRKKKQAQKEDWYQDEADESLEEWKRQQEHKQRHERDLYRIWAFKVLEVLDAGIRIRLPPEIKKDETITIRLNKELTAGYKEGDYVDVTFFKNGDGNTFRDYITVFYGPTPAEFVPGSGEEIVRWGEKEDKK